MQGRGLGTLADCTSIPPPPRALKFTALENGTESTEDRTAMFIKRGTDFQVQAPGMKASSLHSAQRKHLSQQQCQASATAQPLAYLDRDEYNIHTYPDKSRGPQNEKGVHRTNDH